MNGYVVTIIGLVAIAFGSFLTFYGAGLSTKSDMKKLLDENQSLKQEIQQIHLGTGDNVAGDKTVYASIESNKLVVSDVVKKSVNEDHGYNYEIRFNSTKNEQFGVIKINLRIVSGEAIFTQTSGYSSYSIHAKTSISDDGKILKYEISMRPGTDPVIGFFISEPASVEVSANYGLETEIFNLNNIKEG